MADVELKPCPFCGADPIEKKQREFSRNKLLYWICCDNFDCYINPRTDKFYSLSQARDVWNKRAEPKERSARKENKNEV